MDACMSGFTDGLAIAQHTWTQNHPINWSEARVLDCVTRAIKLVLKEVLYNQTTSRGS